MSLLTRRRSVVSAGVGQQFAGNFTGVRGDLGQQDDYKLSNIEVELYAIFHTEFTSRTQLFSIEGDFLNNAGFFAQLKDDDTITLYSGNSGNDFAYSFGLNTTYKINLKYINQTGYVYIQDSLVGSNNYGKALSYNDDGSYIGAIVINTVRNDGNKYIYGFKIWSLDGSGNRLLNYANITLNEGTGDVSFNIADNAPIDSDMTFNPAGSWYTLP